MIKKIVKFIFNFLGFKVTRRKSHYIDAKKTIRNAKQLGKTVCEYVEEIWNIKGNTDTIITKLKEVGAFRHCNEVLEIGPGTGRYLESVLKEVKPSHYHIYEIDKDWANWLQKTYKPFVIAHPADGHSLSATPDNFCGLVHAHGVFVYLPFLTAFEYFSEIVRVCLQGG